MIARWWRRIAQARRTARAHRALRELSDATLLDINAPPWLWREARAMRSRDDRGRALDRLGLGLVQWRW